MYFPSNTVFLQPGGPPQMEPEPGAAGLPRLGTGCMEMKMAYIFCIYKWMLLFANKSPINAIGLVVKKKYDWIWLNMTEYDWIWLNMTEHD